MTKIYHTKMADALPSKKRVAEEKARLEREGSQQRENFRGVLIQLVVNAQFCLEEGTV